jgi:transposase
LEPWLRRAETSGLPAFERFAASLRRDPAAVTAAIALPWSQGPVKGFRQKIKRLKRLLDGRARFDLLRARILHA